MRWLAIILLSSLSLAQGFGGKAGMGGKAGRGGGAAGPAAPTVIGSSTAGSASPLTITLTGSAAINDIVWATCYNLTPNSGTAYNWTMADSASNAWAFASTTNTTWQALNTNNGFAMGAGWVKLTAPLTGGTSTFTITTSVASNPSCYVVKVPSAMGFTALDQIAGATSNFQNPVTSASITPSTTPTLAFGMGIWFNANATFSSYGNIMASAATGLAQNSSTVDVAIEYRQLAATTAGTATINMSTNTGTASIILNFK